MTFAGTVRVALGELGKIVTGRTPPMAKEDFFGGAYPFITPTDMTDQKYIRTTARQLSEQGRALLARCVVPAGSITVSCIGWQMGKAAMTDRDSATNQQLNTIIPNARVDPHFLYYSLCTWRDELRRLGSVGSRTPIVNKGVFSSLELDVPPLSVQRRLASILSAYDDLIENCQRRIRILEEMARALYREWFVLFRYPDHEKVPLVSSTLGEVPKSWRVARLDALADVNGASVDTRCPPESIHYVDISCVSPGRVDGVKTLEFTEAPGRARRIVRHGDVLWSCVRPNRRSHALVLRPLVDTVASTGFAVLSATRIPYSYLYFATTTDDFVAYLTNHATGAAYPAVTAKTFGGAEVLEPPPDILDAFHSAAAPMLEQQHVLERRVENLCKTRDLLLPRLLSGKIRLEDVG